MIDTNETFNSFTVIDLPQITQCNCIRFRVVAVLC